jgi:polar amino acid transport system substrate-binding protein
MLRPARFLACFLAASLLALATHPASAATVDLPPLPDAIKSQGVLRVGVRCDQPPYGYQDGTGAFAGVEVEMGKQIAQYAFGSKDKAVFTCVTAENRVPQLLGNKVDLLIATLGVSPERARVIDFTAPYRWGASDVLIRRDSGIKSLADLSGKTLVALKGSVQAKWFEDHMPDVRVLRLNSAADALQTFRQGRADAYTHDAATLVIAAAHEPNAKLINQYFLISDAAIGVRKNEGAWRDYLSAAIARMRSDNLFIGWVKQYVPEELRSYYFDVFQNGRPDEAATPGASDKTPKSKVTAKVKESASGLSFDTHYLEKQWPTLWSGTLMTVKVSFIAMVLSALIGAIGCAIRVFHVPVLARCVGAYVEVMRNTPILVQLFFIFYGLPAVGLKLSLFASGVLCLTLWAGAYQIENLRGGMASVERRMYESCLALALRPWHYFVSVAMPIAVRNALPSMLNTAISLLKNSSYLQAIGLMELTFVAVDRIATDFRPLEMFSAILVLYLCMVAVLTLLVQQLARRLQRPFKAN